MLRVFEIFSLVKSSLDIKNVYVKSVYVYILLFYSITWFVYPLVDKK